MKIGNKTLLFGCHQFILHPLFVYFAWRKLYKEWPSFGETVSIIIHDWGYFGKTDIDGKDGEKHPERASYFFYNISLLFTFLPIRFADFTNKWYVDCMNLSRLCLYHSRFYANSSHAEPSKLCWADKLSTIMMGKNLWGFLATLSGEAKEYMCNDKYEMYFRGMENQRPRKWFKHYSKHMMPIIYKNAERHI